MKTEISGEFFLKQNEFFLLHWYDVHVFNRFLLRRGKGFSTERIPKE